MWPTPQDPQHDRARSHDRTREAPYHHGASYKFGGIVVELLGRRPNFASSVIYTIVYPPAEHNVRPLGT
jgi:hypothetical protein